MVRLARKTGSVILLCSLIVGCHGCPPWSLTTVPPPSASQKVSTADAEQPVLLTIVGDNDIHGALDSHSETLIFADGIREQVEVGGAEMIAAYYQHERAMNPNGVVLVSAGDFFQGTLIANQFQGAPVIDFFNYLKYDAVAIGNHEFDYGPLRTGAHEHANFADPRGALVARMRQAQFPLLSCNIVDDATHRPPNWPNLACATVVTRRGIKIGLIGAITTETPHATLPDFVRGLSFLPVAEGLRRGIAEAKALGAEIIVAIVHAGTDCKSLDNPLDISSCDILDELPVALQALGIPTVDAIVAGHTHGHIAHFLQGIPVIESGAQGREFGRIALYLDPKSHQVMKDRTQIAGPQSYCHQMIEGTGHCDAAFASAKAAAKLQPAVYLGAAVLPDAQVSKILSDYRSSVRLDQSRVITKIDKPIPRTPFGESPLGDLVTDCMLAGTRRDPQIPDADIAIENSAGMRQDILAGAFTFGALFEVLPFENVLVTAQLTGAQIRRSFELALLANSKILQVAGLRITYAVKNKAGSSSADLLDPATHDYRVAGIELANGKPLLLDRRYTVVWNDFLAAGGDGLAPLINSLPARTQTYHPMASLRQAVEDTLKFSPQILASRFQSINQQKARINFVRR